MSNSQITDHLAAAVRDGVTRASGVVGLAGMGLIHLLDLPSKLDETPYIGWMYIALIAGAILCAFSLMRTGSDRAWTAAAVLALGAMIGYTLTRTVGLPDANGDIGNWLEPLGLASLFVEGILACLGVYVLGARGWLPSIARAGRTPLNVRITQ
ncbi:MAG: hypothetical protein QOF83_3177 [Solirubrobacteraceae bacterium]|nr:hypothetical protein [Solirubrobacteraceae bacterium]